MSRSEWVAVLGLVALVAGCFLPWMQVPDTAIRITGIHTAGTHFGMPGLVHFVLSGLMLLGMVLRKVWAKRANLVFAALNLAWAIRNFVIISKCDGGICPEKLIGLYLIIIASVVIMIGVLFPKATNRSVR